MGGLKKEIPIIPQRSPGAEPTARFEAEVLYQMYLLTCRPIIFEQLKFYWIKFYWKFGTCNDSRPICELAKDSTLSRKARQSSTRHYLGYNVPARNLTLKSPLFYCDPFSTSSTS